MANTTLVICDHCDKRDRTDGPTVHEIVPIKVVVNVNGPIALNMESDLCSECRTELQRAINTWMLQTPKEASDARSH